MRTAVLRAFVLLSLVFLGLALYRRGYLFLPAVSSPVRLAFSLLLLAAGFISGALQWKAILRAKSFSVNVGDSIVSCGLSVFGKYIPGKIWGHLGKAGLIAHTYRYPMPDVTAVSVYGQLLTVWCGLLLGAAGLWITGGLGLLSGTVLLIWLLLTTVLFGGVFQAALERAVLLFLGRQMKVFSIDRRVILRTIPLFTATLLLFAAGFFLFASSLSDTPIHPAAGLAFPLAISLGALAVPFPGGIGVREGVLSSCLATAGLPVPAAVSVAVAARVWFLAGEAALFVLALSMDRGRNLALPGR